MQIANWSALSVVWLLSKFAFFIFHFAMSSPTDVHLMKRLLLAGFVIATCVVSGRAATLADYRHQVSEAIRTIQQLELARDEASASASLARLRAQLPAKETILLQGQSIAADNSWFHDALDEYEKIKTNAR